MKNKFKKNDLVKYIGKTKYGSDNRPTLHTGAILYVTTMSIYSGRYLCEKGDFLYGIEEEFLKLYDPLCESFINNKLGYTYSDDSYCHNRYTYRMAVTASHVGQNIKNVIFNDPATIVFWADGTKTVVKNCDPCYDPEKGLAMAIAKKHLGNEGRYYNVFKKWLPTDEERNSTTIEASLNDAEVLKLLLNSNMLRAAFEDINKAKKEGLRMVQVEGNSYVWRMLRTAGYKTELSNYRLLGASDNMNPEEPIIKFWVALIDDIKEIKEELKND